MLVSSVVCRGRTVCSGTFSPEPSARGPVSAGDQRAVCLHVRSDACAGFHFHSLKNHFHAADEVLYAALNKRYTFHCCRISDFVQIKLVLAGYHQGPIRKLRFFVLWLTFTHSQVMLTAVHITVAHTYTYYHLV